MPEPGGFKRLPGGARKRGPGVEDSTTIPLSPVEESEYRMAQALAYRRAEPRDKAAVLAIEERLGGRDFVGANFDAWAAGPSGGIYVAELGGRVVSYVSIALPKPGEAWLRAMRVDPARQRQGIGRAFSTWQVEEARRLGARVVRLATAGHHPPVHRVFADGMGFQVIGEWVVADNLHEAPRPARSRVSDWARLSDLPRVRAYVAAAAAECPAAGLLPWQQDYYALHSLDVADLEAATREGNLALYREAGHVTGMLICFEAMDGGRRELVVAWADARRPAAGGVSPAAGDLDALPDLAGLMAEVYRRRRAESLVLSLPAPQCDRLMPLLAGWGGEGGPRVVRMRVYERRFAPAP